MAGPPRLLDLVQRSAEWLAERGVPNARREAEWIFADALGIDRLTLYTRHDMPLAAGEVDRLRGLVQRRGRREPLAYVLGHQPFRGLDLRVSPAVLVPRPETEELVERALADLPPGRAARVLDVGTGSGAIALAVAHERPEATVEAVDDDEEALAVARANAERLALAARFHRGHLARDLPGGWDLVIANLPYVADDERGECDPELAFEPARALFPGGDGLGPIGELIADAPRLLAPAGALWCEHGHRQGPAVRALAERHGLACRTERDLAGRERFARIARDG